MKWGKLQYTNMVAKKPLQRSTHCTGGIRQVDRKIWNMLWWERKKRKTILLMNNIRILLSMRVPDWPLVKSIYIENFSSIHYIAIVR